MRIALVFDMDGVLFDSHPVHRIAWRELLRGAGKEVSDAELDFVQRRLLDTNRPFDSRLHKRRTLLTNIQAGHSNRHHYGQKAHSIFAILPRSHKTYWTVILRLLECAFGLVLLQSGVALAEAPMGSVYVPLDSWVYPAFDRLAGLGEINKQFVGLRPWTRIQCAQLVLEAEENMSNADDQGEEATALSEALKEEFSVEINLLNGGSAQQARVESIYTRSMGISGTPLRDSFHFGQTLANDFGRSFNTGFNNVTGVSAQAVWGPAYTYVRGEYQHSLPHAGLTPAQQSVLADIDNTSSTPYLQPAGPVNHFDLLDTYAGLRLWVFDVTSGKQNHDAYTNKGFIIGDTVGRRGAAFDVSSTYWHSPRKRVQVGWREQRVHRELIPNGGAQDSVRVNAEWFIQKQMAFSILAQHERWSFPFLATGKQSDNVVSLQFTIQPKGVWSRAALKTSD